MTLQMQLYNKKYKIDYLTYHSGSQTFFVHGAL